MAKAKDRLRYNAWTLGGSGADVFEKSAEALELERLNPLRGVDEWRLGQIFDDARDGVYADLAWLYNEIEAVEPALATCCDQRESAASECGWLVNTADERRVRGFDRSLADEQRDALLAEFGEVEDDLAELAVHLTGAFFRGAAHALPLWDEDGSLAGFRHLDLWNFALDKASGVWWWNADASRDERTYQPIPPGTLVSLSASRHVDHAALPIFIRAALGAKRYGVWLDRFGIPPVGVIMPPTAEKGDQAAYMNLARKFARGGSGILPSGASIVYGTEARAVCPFTDFIRFQQQQIYTIGLGRVQSGENAGDNLGGNAAGVVESGLRRIVRRDCRRIARAINDGVTRRILERLFPGRPALAQFAWDTSEKRTSRQVLEDAGLARNAGLEIDVGELRELTGYTLSKAPETPAPGMFPGLNAATPLQTPKKPLQNAPQDPDAQGDGKAPDASEGVLEAFAKDTSKAAAAVRKLLADMDAGKDVTADAAALVADLPNLIPDDPALAAVIAEAMANEFAKTFPNEAPADKPAPGSGERTRRAGAGEAASEAANAGTSEGAKKGWETRRKNGWTPEQLAANQETVNTLIEDLNKRGPNNSKAWKNTPKELGELNESVVADILKANPDMKATVGTKQTIDQDQLNHAMEEHGVGNETWPNQIGITHEDLKKIPEVLSSYDEIVKGRGKLDGKQQEGVVYRKKYDDGTICCVQIDWFRRKGNQRELKFQTMWKEAPKDKMKGIESLTRTLPRKQPGS